ncbi:MAG: 2-C-methyl-D-erythritol 2,4-cyclodiphosphate synthase [Oscillospiraceae bacterium]|jgi:2-C-methyl-D-erythritol 2,4-cyclodiphosphate synthase|nr:2-C-methyl-D-erythritol 2,4-cyclodiphosphate synthase [Oscillospiraceae bacterium]
MRIGHGYDAHRLTAGRPLVLGGVEIESPLGLEGHSDADVLCHAVMDALLGAAGLEDIGHWFPNTDPAYRGACSLDLLRRVSEMLTARGFAVGNVDVTVVAQRPALAPHRAAMRRNLARALGCDPDQIGIKATTEEGMGFTGAGEGIAAHAVALLFDTKNQGISSYQSSI